MKKLSETYQLIENKRWSVQMTINKELGDHVSIHEFGEPCSGILKHWGSKKDLIKELENIIEELKKQTK